MRRCLASSVSDSPTTRLARSTASPPTSVLSDWSACWRSASLCACAASPRRRASPCACSRISAMICAPCSRASSRSRAASCLASASCSRYLARVAFASAWVSSARCRPPSILSVRSASVWLSLGSRTFQRAKKMMPNVISPTMSSVRLGISGFCSEAARRRIMAATSRSGVLLDEERDGDADQRQRLGQRETDPHVGGDPARGLRLPCHGLDGVPEDQADADARPDRGQAVGERPEVNDVNGLGGREDGGHYVHSQLPFRPADLPPPGSG